MSLHDAADYAAARAQLRRDHERQSCVRALQIAEVAIKFKAEVVASDLRRDGQRPHPAVGEFGELFHARGRLHDLRLAVSAGFVEPWGAPTEYPRTS